MAGSAPRVGVLALQGAFREHVQALDRLGPTDKEPNGLFTRLFLREMQKPGQPVDRVLRSVRSEVARLARSVGHEQTPALYDQSLGDFFLKP